MNHQILANIFKILISTSWFLPRCFSCQDFFIFIFSFPAPSSMFPSITFSHQFTMRFCAPNKWAASSRLASIWGEIFRNLKVHPFLNWILIHNRSINFPISILFWHILAFQTGNYYQILGSYFSNFVECFLAIFYLYFQGIFAIFLDIFGIFGVCFVGVFW